jgi:hypothetical protein
MQTKDGWNDDDWEPMSTSDTNSTINTSHDWDKNTNQSFMSQSSSSFSKSKGIKYENKRKLNDDSFVARNDWSGFGRGRAKRVAESNSSQFDDSWGNRETNYSSKQSEDDWGQRTQTHNSQNYRESDSWTQPNSRSFNNSDRFRDNSNRNSPKRTIQISSSFVGKVIGRAGSTIKEFQSKSGARISVNKDSSNSYETDIDLSGSNEQMDCAESLIKDLIGNGGNSWQSSRSGYNSSNNNNNTYEKKAEPETKEEEFIDWGAAIKESEEATKRKWAALPPIKKSFYFESNDIRMMNPQEVSQFRLQNNNIMVDHFNEGDVRPIPNPIQKFEQAFEHFRRFYLYVLFIYFH